VFISFKDVAFRRFAMSPRADRAFFGLPTDPHHWPSNPICLLSFFELILRSLSLSSLNSKESASSSALKVDFLNYPAWIWYLFGSDYFCSSGILSLIGEGLKELITGAGSATLMSLNSISESSWVWCVFILLSRFLRSVFYLRSISSDCSRSCFSRFRFCFSSLKFYICKDM
jgi:hypothetical protein